MKVDNHTTTYPIIQNILIRFLLDKDYCPSREYADIDYPLLLRTAGANKAEHVMLHMLGCATCQKRIRPAFLTRLHRLNFRLKALPLLRRAELKTLRAALARYNIRAVMFKEYPGRIRVGGDIDILISADGLARLSRVLMQEGYAKTRHVAHKENQFISPQNRYKIDAHHLVAYPQYGGLSSSELRIVRQFTYDLLQTAGASVGITYLKAEWYVFTRIFHYWYNDMACGLYPLFEIISFCHRHRKTIRWSEVLRLADAYGMHNECIYVLLVGSTVFDIPLPDPIERRVSFRIRLVASATTRDDIIFFPPISRWHQKRYKIVAHKMYLRYLFAKLLLNKQTPVIRLLRMRILAFAGRGLYMYVRRQLLKNERNIQQKFPERPVKKYIGTFSNQ